MRRNPNTSIDAGDNALNRDCNYKTGIAFYRQAGS